MVKSGTLEYQRAQYAKHRAKRLAAKKAERDADPEAARAYQRAMYAKHREKRVAEARERRKANKEELAAKALIRYHKNREAILKRRAELRERPEARAKASALMKQWSKNNPEKVQLHYAKNLLAEQVGLRHRDIPDDLAAAKLEQLKITRWVREQLAASGIETEGQDAEERLGAEHESPAPQGDAQ
jgi:hypothetical protein